MSLFLLNNKNKIVNPKTRFGKELVFWINSWISPKTMNNNSISQINDLSVNVRHSIQSTATYQPTFMPGGYNGLPYLNFNSANSQSLDILNFNVTGIMTVCVSVSRSSGITGKIFGGNYYNINGFQISYRTSNAGINIQGSISGNTWNINFDKTIDENINRIVVVVDNINLKLKLYINGEKVGTDQSMPYAYADRLNSQSRIFKEAQTSGGALSGNLYDFFIVNRELTNAEIQKDYKEWFLYK